MKNVGTKIRHEFKHGQENCGDGVAITTLLSLIHLYMTVIMLIDYSTTKLGTSHVAKCWDDVCLKPQAVYRKPVRFESMQVHVTPGDFLVVSKGEDSNQCDVVVGVLDIVGRTIVGNVFATRGSFYGGGKRNAGYLKTKKGKFEEVVWTKEICRFHGDHHTFDIWKAKVHMENDLQDKKKNIEFSNVVVHYACRFRYNENGDSFDFETAWHPW